MTAMSHETIEAQEVVERYVRDQLPADERRAFEEHYFDCDACFRQLQETDRFVAAVRHAAAAGVLGSGGARPVWWTPALMAAALAVAASGLVGGWAITEVRRLRGELRQERAARELPAQPNIAVVALLSARDAGTRQEVRLAAEDRSLVLWIDVEPGLQAARLRIELSTEDGRPVVSVPGLVPNDKNAVTAGLDARSLATGDYRVRLYAEGRQPPVQEYALAVRRR